MKTKIELVRIVKPTVVCGDSGARIEQRAETVAVHFNDAYGNHVSVAFDGRCDTRHEYGYKIRETYTLFADCPVIDSDNGQSGPVRDVMALRILRDALLDMKLED